MAYSPCRRVFGGHNLWFGSYQVGWNAGLGQSALCSRELIREKTFVPEVLADNLEPAHCDAYLVVEGSQ